MSQPAIVAAGLCKVYRRFVHQNQFRTLKSALLTGSLLADLRPDQLFSALDGVSFEVPRGAFFGVIGENGSGKSTLLKLLAGISKPSRGTLEVSGRVSALIELGAGFHPEISGRENVLINGIMLGLSRREVAERFDAIVDFAELREFIDAPVKNYSSGMYARLGFAVAVHAEPDILLVDEVLAVGDEAFSRKCLDKISDFRRRGRTIVIVTHSLGLVEQLCDEALWLKHGKVAGRGDARRVVGAYLSYVAEAENRSLKAANDAAQAVPEQQSEPPAAYQPGRWGSGEVQITALRLLDARGEERHVYVTGEPMTVAMKVHSRGACDDFVFGVGLYTADGTSVYGTNTDIESFKAEHLEGDAEVRLTLQSLDLVPGTYLVDVAAHRKDGTPYDYHRALHSFRMKSRVGDVGIWRPAHQWCFAGAVAFSRTEAPPEYAVGEVAHPDEEP
jgi:ABC-type polysaccharide/polyol phosphate transport system ATPase subunit